VVVIAHLPAGEYTAARRVIGPLLGDRRIDDVHVDPRLRI
jgi:hypothetical protein